MNIKEFIQQFHNHPIFFIGTGFSLRYLSNSYSWDSLLKNIAQIVYGNEEKYLELTLNHNYRDFDKVASILEDDLTKFLVENRNHPELKYINDNFFELAREKKNISRFKILISKMLSDLEKRNNENIISELSLLKKARKNIGSIITTNYDLLIEDIFEFNPLIGNDILLSNPYGSVYKIHGCVTKPDSLIITASDYEEFNKRYELIRAQLLSLFIHNPIIFIGYSISDDNIKALLKTIFSYVKPNSDQANQIRDNFLLIEYAPNCDSEEVVEHDIDLEGYSTIRINKLRTDNYSVIYQSIANLNLPVSAMDIRKVQNVIAEIVSGSNIKVSITEDIDSLRNDDKILVIGSKNTIKYEYQKATGMMNDYFTIIEEENASLLELLNHQTIKSRDFFPIYAFSKICSKLKRVEEYKQFQISKLKSHIKRIEKRHNTNNTSIDDIFTDNNISPSAKEGAIFFEVYQRNITLEECKNYLLKYKDKNSTDYRRLLCLYDYMTNSAEPLI